jgi:hypothetical protein
MFHIVFNILKEEGILIKVFLFFSVFSPLYLLDIFLVIPVALLLLHNEILNQTAPSEQIVTLFKTFGCSQRILLCSNSLVISAINLLNGTILLLLSFYVGENIQFYDYLKQVILLNGILFFSAAFSNGLLNYRLNRSAFKTVHKGVIISLFGISVLIVFTVLFLLVQNRLSLACILFLLILLTWGISVYKRI